MCKLYYRTDAGSLSTGAGQRLAGQAGAGEHTATTRPGEPVARLASLLGELGFNPELETAKVVALIAGGILLLAS